jgi:hypothetical protein
MIVSIKPIQIGEGKDKVMCKQAEVNLAVSPQGVAWTDRLTATYS